MRRFIVPLTMLLGFIIFVTGYLCIGLTTCAFQPGATTVDLFFDVIDIAILLAAIILLVRLHRTKPPRP